MAPDEIALYRYSPFFEEGNLPYRLDSSRNPILDFGDTGKWEKVASSAPSRGPARKLRVFSVERRESLSEPETVLRTEPVVVCVGAKRTEMREMDFRHRVAVWCGPDSDRTPVKEIESLKHLSSEMVYAWQFSDATSCDLAIFTNRAIGSGVADTKPILTVPLEDSLQHPRALRIDCENQAVRQDAERYVIEVKMRETLGLANDAPIVIHGPSYWVRPLSADEMSPGTRAALELVPDCTPFERASTFDLRLEATALPTADGGSLLRLQTRKDDPNGKTVPVRICDLFPRAQVPHNARSSEVRLNMSFQSERERRIPPDDDPKPALLLLIPAATSNETSEAINRILHGMRFDLAHLATRAYAYGWTTSPGGMSSNLAFASLSDPAVFTNRMWPVGGFWAEAGQWSHEAERIAPRAISDAARDVRIARGGAFQVLEAFANGMAEEPANGLEEIKFRGVVHVVILSDDLYRPVNERDSLQERIRSIREATRRNRNDTYLRVHIVSTSQRDWVGWDLDDLNTEISRHSCNDLPPQNYTWLDAEYLDKSIDVGVSAGGVNGWPTSSVSSSICSALGGQSRVLGQADSSEEGDQCGLVFHIPSLLSPRVSAQLDFVTAPGADEHNSSTNLLGSIKNFAWAPLNVQDTARIRVKCEPVKKTGVFALAQQPFQKSHEWRERLDIPHWPRAIARVHLAISYGDDTNVPPVHTVTMNLPAASRCPQWRLLTWPTTVAGVFVVVMGIIGLVRYCAWGPLLPYVYVRYKPTSGAEEHRTLFISNECAGSEQFELPAPAGVQPSSKPAFVKLSRLEIPWFILSLSTWQWAVSTQNFGNHNIHMLACKARKKPIAFKDEHGNKVHIGVGWLRSRRLAIDQGMRPFPATSTSAGKTVVLSTNKYNEMVWQNLDAFQRATRLPFPWNACLANDWRQFVRLIAIALAGVLGYCRYSQYDSERGIATYIALAIMVIWILSSWYVLKAAVKWKADDGHPLLQRAPLGAEDHVAWTLVETLFQAIISLVAGQIIIQ